MDTQSLFLVGFLVGLLLTLAAPNFILYLAKATIWFLYNSFRILMSITLVMLIITIILGNNWWMRV